MQRQGESKQPHEGPVSRRLCRIVSRWTPTISILTPQDGQHVQNTLIGCGVGLCNYDTLVFFPNPVGAMVETSTNSFCRSENISTGIPRLEAALAPSPVIAGGLPISEKVGILLPWQYSAMFLPSSNLSSGERSPQRRGNPTESSSTQVLARDRTCSGTTLQLRGRIPFPWQ
jgi:hypothetical protein